MPGGVEASVGEPKYPKVEVVRDDVHRLIKKVAREMREAGEENARRKERESPPENPLYKPVESYFAIVQPCGWNHRGEPVLWRAVTLERVDEAKGLGELRARGPTPEIAVQRLRWELAVMLRESSSLRDWEKCRARARDAVFNFEVVR